ncbi:MAG: Flp pilus assembly protein CpaB [Proteobacteria bacterium]|nr:Flp pilus assembly protein CpaB [Pseudomonadota bacterium]
MKVSPRWIVLGAAAVFGVSAGFGSHSYIQSKVTAIEAANSHVEFVKQVVPNQDMPRGARLTTETVAVRAVPKEWAYADALTPDQLSRFENAALQAPARRGQPILWAQLAAQGPRALSDRLEPGRRAITVPVDEVSSMAGMIKPGDRIDLLVSIRQNTRVTLMPLLQRALVLATGAQTQAQATDAPEGRGYNSMTLDVSPEDARRIFAAREIGRLTAVLRTVGDEEDQPAAVADAASILGLSSAPRQQGGARVIYADRLALQPAVAAALRRLP